MKMRIVFTIALWICSTVAFAEPLICDGASANFIYGKRGPWGYETVTLTVKRGETSIRKQYEYVWFGAACLTGVSGKKYLAYQAYCSGSACRDLDNWGIVDPITLKILLEPTDDNRKKAVAILGQSLKPLPTTQQ